MAKRELSSTLRNLKFMQRGANKEAKSRKEEEIIPDANFPSNLPTKKCMVTMEGDPSPGATRGRMSFQSFNPSIDKLNEEASNTRQSQGDATWSGNRGGELSNRENEELVSLHINNVDGDFKRKQDEVEVQFPNNSPNIIKGNQRSLSNNSRKKSHKRGKLDFNVLRSPNS
ncbi:hypothetical protein SSX86_015272 [Deinandra increscens subsp. villosa]|uniref:M-phase phosphoprotein 6 n=1 Tax=Deinandra increscens subsp. villosa TaxID=3103831 RepID=A0AAP0D499_9ASTR